MGRVIDGVYSLAVDDEAPDLRVVCPNCGSQVSPYVTECPYCGNRVRKRAPKLGSRDDPARKADRLRKRAERRRPKISLAGGPGFGERKLVVVPTLVLTSIVLSCLVRAGFIRPGRVEVFGSLTDERWKLLTAPFVHLGAAYGFIALASFAIFGARIERSLGRVATLAVWVVAGGAGAWLASIDGASPAGGALAAAVAVTVARCFSVVEANRDGEEEDLVGPLVVLIVLSVLPAFGAGASWYALGAGLVVGILTGCVVVVRERRERSG